MQPRKLLKKLFPGLARLYRRVQKARVDRQRRKFAAYSVQETFAEVYRTNRWGSADDAPFCSGDGSNDEYTARYVDSIATFVRERGVRRILDIGCGDFRVGRKLVAAVDAHYIGLDVVPDLIDYNSRTHGDARVAFMCANAIEDELPDADLCLIRQVLQHLSNAQVSAIMAKCERYPYVIVTEDVCVGPEAVPNVDKPHGPDTRWAENSGIYLDLPPFNYATKTLLESTTGNAVLRSVLLESSAGAVAGG